MEVEISGGSASPTPGGSASPTPGGLDASFPPKVVEAVHELCNGLNCSDDELMDVAAWYVESEARLDELVARSIGQTPGTLIITAAEFAKRARKARKNDAEWFPNEYKLDNNIKEERTCIWRQGSGLWTEKSSGIMWVAVHGENTICVVTEKADLDRGRFCGGCFKLIPEKTVRAFFRKFIICEIEDLVHPPTELRQCIKKPSGVDLVDPLSTALSQSRPKSIEKPFGVVSVDNGSGKKASSAVLYEEKAIEFLTEKLNRDTDFNVEETIKTAVCAFQCLFPKKLKATEIEVSVMDPMYRVDNPKYRVGPVDEFTDRTVWEVPTEVYEKYLDAVDESVPGEIVEPFPKKPRLTPAGSSNILLG